MSAFYEEKTPQICYTAPAACQRFSPTHIEAKEQICSIKSTETTHNTGGVLDLPVTHRQACLLAKDSVSCLQLYLCKYLSNFRWLLLILVQKVFFSTSLELFFTKETM